MLVQSKIMTPVFVITFPFTVTTCPDFTLLRASKVPFMAPVEVLFLGAMVAQSDRSKFSHKEEGLELQNSCDYVNQDLA